MRLPEVTYALSKSGSENVSLHGINWSDSLQDGDLRESENISARRYPYFTTRHARAQQKRGETFYQNGIGMTAWGKLVVIEKTTDSSGAEVGQIYYDGEAIGTVTAGEKQFAVVNTRMVIWPDKVYIDMPTKTIRKMEADFTASKPAFTTSTLKISESTDLTTLFAAGDAVEISGCTQTYNNKSVIIKALTSDTITVAADTFKYSDTSTSTSWTDTSTTVKIERSVPDMDYICESENRLWGCSSAAQTIYASALGDPTNFNVFEGLSTDSYALGVGTEGDFTGCCKLSTSVLFWKESKLHKMLGSYPAEYSLTSYDIDGLMAGCHKSMQVINEVLFYMGLHGIFAYSGGTPSLISQNFGERRFSDGVGGNDGDTYFLSVKDEDGKAHLLVYETRYGIWLHEDDTEAMDFARVGRDMYMLDANGNVWLEDSGTDDTQLPWTMQFTPFYETVQGHKSYSKVTMRFELPKGSYVTAEIRTDDKTWQQVGKLVGNVHDIATLRLPINRCDKFELRLSGKGECTLLGLYREFYVGSEA